MERRHRLKANRAAAQLHPLRKGGATACLFLLVALFTGPFAPADRSADSGILPDTSYTSLEADAADGTGSGDFQPDYAPADLDQPAAIECRRDDRARDAAETRAPASARSIRAPPRFS